MKENKNKSEKKQKIEKEDNYCCCGNSLLSMKLEIISGEKVRSPVACIEAQEDIAR